MAHSLYLGCTLAELVGILQMILSRAADVGMLGYLFWNYVSSMELYTLKHTFSLSLRASGALLSWGIMILRGFGGCSEAASWMWVFVCLLFLFVSSPQQRSA